MKRIVVILAGVAGLCGCMTLGNRFPPPDGAVAIQTNKTTQNEIQKSYGAPDMQGLEDGDTTWTYLYLRAGPFTPAEAEHLTIRFNKDGTVHSYSFNSNLTDSK